MLFIKRFSLVSAALTLLISCGGGGGGTSAPNYTGLTTPAVITAANAEPLSKTSSEASSKAITQDASNDANPFGPVGISISFQTSSAGNNLMSEIGTTLYNELKNKDSLPAGANIAYTQLGANFCGGSVTTPDNFNGNTTLNGKITLNNLCYNDPATGAGQIILNGTITFVDTANGFSMAFSMKITAGGKTQSISMSLVCSASRTDCTITSDYFGDDGKTYRLADFSVSETFPGSKVFNFNARLYHPDHGYTDIDATDMTYGCASGHPDGGSIAITGANGSTANIDFRNDCSGFDGDWFDGTSGSIFNVNW